MSEEYDKETFELIDKELKENPLVIDSGLRVPRAIRKCTEKGQACGEDECKYCVCYRCDFTCLNLETGLCCTCRDAEVRCELESCEVLK